MSARPPYIVVEGVIGAGKTTLARILAAPFAAETLLEVVEENPFLSNFYGDRARYAFQTETFFLLSRYRQQQAVVQPAVGNSALVSDYLFAKNQLFAGLNLAGDEWDLFQQLFRALSERVVRPDLVVYLQANVDTHMARIAERDRSFERNMDRGYIEQLRQTYDRFFSTYVETRLLAVETDTLDLVRDADARAHVIGAIRATLEGYEQQSLVV
ncbi:MAG: Deoxyadenosine kinase @ Deoxyguanosine kinase [uncultured Chloroflexia bacterium]|uniref:Deoxyadenosine kinase @ Deoxyguanosine kinase n=1 Tax=uncultured Chloroflexia bacterium TaxID=1672391 RepID=A0A6J4JIX7_9CHLR|nr:MAG: Deoxyadenosine kinase @ Deoxyguanosine kinase [uncultured Chloroflexia bacterium]